MNGRTISTARVALSARTTTMVLVLATLRAGAEPPPLSRAEAEKTLDAAARAGGGPAPSWRLADAGVAARPLAPQSTGQKALDAAGLPASSRRGVDAGPTEAPPLEAVIRVTLLGVPHLPDDGDGGRRAWRIGGDAHWLVSVHVDQLVSGEAPFKVGETVHFLVHSPSMLFRGEGTASSTHQLRVTWTRVEGSARVRWIELAD